MATDELSSIPGVLRNPEQALRAAGLMALRDVRPRETAAALISFLDSPDTEIRRRAAQALVYFREHLEPFTTTLIENLLGNTDENVRLGCAILLMDKSDNTVTDAYVRALADPFEKVVQLACLETGNRKANSEALKGVLKHSNWRVRLEACKAFITQGSADEDVISTLEKMATEDEAQVHDQECDDFAQIEAEIRQETGDAGPGMPTWGKMATILSQAREVAASGRPSGPSAG